MTEATRVNAIVSKHPSLRLGELAWFGRPGARVFPFNAPRQRYFTFARNALAAALDALRLKPDDEILVPAFHCVTAVEPIVRAGLRCVFYGIDRHIRADRPSLHQAITPRTRAVVVIHFFGFAEPLDDICELCRSRGIVLIEDCTHALYSTEGGRLLGTRGELAMFSLRKTLPVFGGALLVANNDTIPLPDVSRPPPWGYSLRAVKATANLWRARPEVLDVPATESSRGADNARLAITSDADSREQTMDDWLYGYAFNPDLNDRRGARVCAWVAERTDPAAVRRERRKNYESIVALLKGVPRIDIPRPALPDGACPWAFSLDAAAVPGLDRRLRCLRVPAFTFGEVLHDAVPLAAFPDAGYLSRNLIQLPIHQGMSDEQLRQIARSVQQAVGVV